MAMNQKQRIEELERRVRELEQREPMKIYYPIMVPYHTYPNPYPVYPTWTAETGASYVGNSTFTVCASY
jgi:hypothetical protein